MSSTPSKYTPTTITKLFAWLDNRLLRFGLPGALEALGLAKVNAELWWQAVGCFAGAGGVWLAIEIGKNIAPRLDCLLGLAQLSSVAPNAKQAGCHC